jgi:transcriptional regulator with AAA-type ATPase domain
MHTGALPIRPRKGDIPSLVHHFIYRKSIELKLKERPKLVADAIDRLTAYDGPVNVRELENTIERALIQHRAGVPLFIRNAPSPGGSGQRRPGSKPA